MDAVTRAGYLAHARLPVFQRRVERALSCVREALALCQSPFVSYSGGKDSSAMTWLCLQVNPQLPIRMLTGGETRLLHPSLDHLLNWWREQFPGIDLIEINIDHVFAEDWQTASFQEQHRSFKDGWNRYLNAAGDWDGVFIGLRAGESGMRKWRTSQRIPGTDKAIYQYRSGPRAGTYRICPIDDWTVDDIGALHVLHDIPLLDTYETGGLDRRTHYRIGHCSLLCGQLDELRQEHPEQWRMIIERFPELDY